MNVDWKEGWEENLQRVLRAVKAIEKASFVEVKINYAGGIEVVAFPNDDAEEKRSLVNGLTHLVGVLKKEINGTEIAMKGVKDGIEVRIPSYDKCEIVGYVEEEVPETITTGHMVKRQVPVSDCELKQGKYAGKQVVINAPKDAVHV